MIISAAASSTRRPTSRRRSRLSFPAARACWRMSALQSGLSLTKALGAFAPAGLWCIAQHQAGEHRIFVGGVPKIADIGLVAAGQARSRMSARRATCLPRPGSMQSDIYSLGKVIYELAMGKDRMDFPAVNTDIAELPDKAALLRLNEVLLRACAGKCTERYAPLRRRCTRICCACATGNHWGNTPDVAGRSSPRWRCWLCWAPVGSIPLQAARRLRRCAS